MGVESQSMEEGNSGNGDNVETLFENVLVDHANQNIDGMGEPPHGGDHYYGIPCVFQLNKACQPIFLGVRCSQLLAILTLMNICTIHRCTYKFVDELMSLLHKYILLVGNCVPLNMYQAKSLTRKMSLEYKTIHACSMGCVLYRVCMPTFKTTQSVVYLNTRKLGRHKSHWRIYNMF